VVRRQHMTPRQQDIVNLENTIRRSSARPAHYHKIYCPPKHCCPSCALGLEFTSLVEKYERQITWLLVLLHKEGRHRDIEYWTWQRNYG